jgi:hypothetical protein
VQEAGEKAGVVETKQVEEYLNGKLRGEKEVPVLFELALFLHPSA